VTVSVRGDMVELKSTAANSVDWVNVMAFNLFENNAEHSSFNDSIAALQRYENAGIPIEKLNLGIPFYGKINGGGDKMTYKEIVSECSPQSSDNYCNGYFFNGIDLVQQKSRYVLDNEYGGVMIWHLDQDTYDKTSLLNAINEVFSDQSFAEKSNPVIFELKKTSNGILILWTQEEPISQSYDIIIDGIDTDRQYRTVSSPQIVDNGECFIVQARYPEEDIILNSISVCFDPLLIHAPESSQKVPYWFKNTMEWYADGLISKYEINSATKFLIEEGIIKLD